MITLTDVHKRFGKNHVLQGATLSIGRGQSMVIIGGSGTGKSVLLKCILGLVKPDSGTITVDGQPTSDATDREAFLARFGMLFQGGALFDSLPVWQNVAFRLLRGATKRPKAEARDIAIEKLRRVGLKPEVAEVTMRPENTIELSGDDAARMQKLLDMLEDLDDVQDVFHNASIES